MGSLPIKLRDEPVFQEVFRLNLSHQFGISFVLCPPSISAPKPQSFLADTARNDGFHAVKSSAAYEEDICGCPP